MSTHPIAPELNSAYLVFCEEFQRHLTVIAGESRNQEIPDAEQERETRRRRIENRFHTIRGAAGFFQLDEIYRISTEGEKLFHIATEKEDFAAALEALPGIVDSLQKCELPTTNADE